MTVQSKIRMTVPEFLTWAEAQPEGNFELVDGEVLTMSPERVRHNLAKMTVFRALSTAVERAQLTCTVYGDGVAVIIDEKTVRVPDASIQCGIDQDRDALSIDSPLIVVEVISPSSERADFTAKLAEYFSVPSVYHYLIVDPVRPVLIHHARAAHGAIETRIFSSGEVNLKPPGITMAAAELLGSR